MLNVRGHCPRHRRISPFIMLKPLTLTIEALRPQAGLPGEVIMFYGAPLPRLESGSFWALAGRKLRSEAFSLVCLFRSSEFLSLIPIATHSQGRRG